MACLACLLLVLMLVIPALPGKVQAFNGYDFEYQVTIPDANLHQELRKACNMLPYILDPRYPTNKMLAGLTGTLNIEGKGIKDLTGIQYCINISELAASYNSLTSLPDMQLMTGLKTLHLNRCTLTEIPSFIPKLPNLEALSMMENKIKNLANLKGCPKLLHLNLDDNQISSIPSGLGLATLSTIHLHTNKFSAFPKAILEYKNLESIDLRFNQLSSLPDALGKMPKLGRLFLDDNNLTSLPGSLGSGKLNKLFVAANKLTSIPDALFKSKTIKTLDLSFNYLTQLPSGIANSSYDSLDLQMNFLDVSQGSKTLQLINKISATEKKYQTQLTPIQNLKATPGKDQIRLTWNPCPDSTSNPKMQGFVSHYDVYLKEGNKLTLLGNIQKSSTPTFIDTNLAPGTKREYSIAVVYEVNSDYYDQVSPSYSSISAETPPEETTTATTTTEEPTTSEITTSTTSASSPTTDPTDAVIQKPEEPGKATVNSLLGWILGGIGLVLLIVGAVLVWLLVIRPRMRKK